MKSSTKDYIEKCCFSQQCSKYFIVSVVLKDRSEKRQRDRERAEKLRQEVREQEETHGRVYL